MNIEDLMELMLNLFNNTDKSLKNKYEELSNVDMKLSDLDHYLEIHSLKSYELVRLATTRQKLRRERRDIKNEIDLIEQLKKFTDKYNTKFITGDIIQFKKDREKLLNKQTNPTYTYRTDIINKVKGENNKQNSKDIS